MSSPAASATSAYCPLPTSGAEARAVQEEVRAALHDAASPIPVGHFRGRHFLSVSSLTRPEIDRLMVVADCMARIVGGPGTTDLGAGCLMASVFYEPSTRTSSSFQAAMMRLGGQVLAIGDVSNSSVAKGETLEDTMRCLQSYANLIVMRHPETGSAARAAKVLQVPLINAGDGVGEHPTQALLDLYTLHGEFDGRVDGLTVTMVGDLRNGRTVHSLAKLLTHFPRCTLHFVSPASLAMPTSVLEVLAEKKIQFTQANHLDDVMETTDVLYVTRVQKERFASPSEYDAVKDEFLITPDLLTKLRAKSTMRILHPLPRVNELAHELDSDPRAAYFRQMKHGLHVRMALIACLLGRA